MSCCASALSSAPDCLAAATAIPALPRPELALCAKLATLPTRPVLATAVLAANIAAEPTAATAMLARLARRKARRIEESIASAGLLPASDSAARPL